jgi:hypothetical protein
MYGVAISWASDNAAIDAATGVVTRPATGAGDATVTLTASLSIGTETPVDVTFTVTVTETPAAPINAAAAVNAAVDDNLWIEATVKHILSDNTFIVEDADGSTIWVDDYSATVDFSTLGLAVGDLVRVTGDRGFYKVPLVDTVSAVEIVSNGNALSGVVVDVVDPATFHSSATDASFGKTYSFTNVTLISVESYYIYFYSSDGTTGGTDRLGIVVGESVDLTALNLQTGDVVSFDAVLYGASGTYTDNTKILRFAIADDTTVVVNPS